MPDTPASSPPSDPGLVLESEPTPVFRRFPWIQLVFCLACLSMTGWTWMRYSYCWPIHVREIARSEWRSEAGPSLSSSHLDRFVEVKAIVYAVGRIEGEYGGSVVSGRVTPSRYTWLAFEWPGRVTSRGMAILELSTAPPERGSLATVRGRVDAQEEMARDRGFDICYFLDGTRGRWHPASIAGLVVGAMGCFIFGLYLRAWLRERKALASEPPQDMIA
jgi:hypothetical protein